MKKTFVLMIAVFAVAMVFTACTKEGQYMPKQKISEIVHTKYYKLPTGTIISDTKYEVWSWNGKLLSYIDYYDANEKRIGTSLFRYDKDNRIEEINYNTTTAEFEYDDGLIDEIKIVGSNGTVLEKYEFEHKGNTVMAINITSNDDKSMEAFPFNPLCFFLPEDAANNVMKSAAAKGGTIRILLTWKGRNVVAAEVNGGSKISYKWSYDDKINPFKGLFDEETADSYMVFSENNVVREELTDNGVATSTDFRYTYDKKYPVKKEWESETTFIEANGETYESTLQCVDEYKY